MADIRSRLAVLPASVAFTHDYLANCLPRVRRYGVSVLLADEERALTTDVAGRNETVPVEDTATTRWVNELVYERVLTTAQGRPQDRSDGAAVAIGPSALCSEFRRAAVTGGVVDRRRGRGGSGAHGGRQEGGRRGGGPVGCRG